MFHWQLFFNGYNEHSQQKSHVCLHYNSRSREKQTNMQKQKQKTHPNPLMHRATQIAGLFSPSLSQLTVKHMRKGRAPTSLPLFR